jgi:hypothetical protein
MHDLTPSQKGAVAEAAMRIKWAHDYEFSTIIQRLGQAPFEPGPA